MIRYILLILFAGLVVNSCGQKENPAVNVYGALFEIMHKGDLSSRISLSQFDNDANIFALGALKDLEG